VLLFTKAIVAVGLVGLLAVGAIARPDLNAFLNQKVTTTSELVAQAKRDPAVMDRYMRHFGMTRTEVLAYLSSLKPAQIHEDTLYAIYSVPEGGHIKMHLAKLKKGENVFALQDGTPQLMVKCGNPLTLGPKNVVALNHSPVTTSEIVAEEVPQELLTDVDTEFQPLASMQPAEPTYAFNNTTTNPVQLPVLPGGFNPLPLALGGLAFINHGGGHSPVPEPGTMLALGAGLSAIAARKRRKK
jgi:hypothetical protein